MRPVIWTVAMTDKSSYGDYVTDHSFLEQYNSYQTKYAERIRESDKVLIGLIREILDRRENQGRALRLLDVGCSTGNLLLHLKRLFPHLELMGADLAESSLAACASNPQLDGVRFERRDMLDLGYRDQFDIIVANAVAVYFYWDEYATAIGSVARALKPGGTYVGFEWLHPFRHQDVVITETSVGHPNGLRICFRPIPRVAEVLEAARLTDLRFIPFELPIELPMPSYDDDVFSYTVKAADGANLCFRGTLFQPWCHFTATKRA